jgi:hypothetical protein
LIAAINVEPVNARSVHPRVWFVARDTDPCRRQTGALDSQTSRWRRQDRSGVLRGPTPMAGRAKVTASAEE